MKQANEKIIVQLAAPERKFVKTYHDFLRNKLLTTEEKMAFIALKSFMDFSKDNGGTQGEVYPSLNTICRLTSLSKPRAIKAINKLVEKKIVKKIRRGLSKTNVYVLSDFDTMWTCDSVEEMAAVADNKGETPLTIEKCISILEHAGYKVEQKKKAPVSANPQIADTSAHKHLHNNTTTNKPESQERDSDEDAKADADVKAEANALLDRLWALYPVKKGKGRISAVQRKKLLEIGYEEMERAINRYKKYVESVDWLHYQNGSTFFNGGYIDYLDANYDPESEREARRNQAKNSQTKNTQKRNTFNDYPHREYDFDAIKRNMFKQ